MENSENINNNKITQKPSVKTDKVILGFADTPRNGDFEIEKFPSKLGGLPVWITPLEGNIDKNFFTCHTCKKNLSFLLQLYCPLENNENAYHRMIYVFYCKSCWEKNNIVKILRINLSENSKYNQGDNLKCIDLIKKDKIIKETNSFFSKNLLEEFYIDTNDEKKDASKLYFGFYNNIEEKSNVSSINTDEDIEEYDLKISNKNEVNEYNIMLENYLKENPDANINQIEEESEEEKESDEKLDGTNKDIIMNVFKNVTKFNKTQIIRYFRNNYYPLWFTKEEMYTTKNLTCKHCKGQIEFEFQIMPYLFLIEPKISSVDIGTIVVYTCHNCCCNQNEIGFVEEYGFIQRTGEKDEDFEKIMTDNNNENKEINEKKILFSGVNEKNADEEGFVEVKKNKKTKKQKKESSSDDEDLDK